MPALACPSYSSLGRHSCVRGRKGWCLLTGPLYQEANGFLGPPCRLLVSLCEQSSVTGGWEGDLGVKGDERSGLGAGPGLAHHGCRVPLDAKRAVP